MKRTYIFLSIFFLSYAILYSQEWRFLGLKKVLVSVIAVDPNNPNIIYAGGGFNSNPGIIKGIFKSTDGGAVWDTLINGPTVFNLVINPINSQVIYANVVGTILKSTDGGKNWTKTDSGIVLNIDYEVILVLEMDPKYPDTLYAGTGGNGDGFLYKTTDGGKSWDRLNNSGNPLNDGIIEIAINPLNSKTIYVGTQWNGFVLKSYDGGISWTYIDISRGLMTIGFSKDTSTVYAGTGTSDQYPIGFFKSSGNQKWTNGDIKGLPDTLGVNKIQICKECSGESIYLTGDWRESKIWKFNSNKNEWEYIGINNEKVNTITISGTKLYAGGEGIYVMDNLASVTKQDRPVPNNFYLDNSYPNPFNSNTNIRYGIGKESNVFIEVYDILGRKIKTLVNERKLPGEYKVSWDGTDNLGNTVSSGVYTCVLKCDNQMLNIKMEYMK